MDMIYQVNQIELGVNDILQLVEIVYGEGIVKNLDKLTIS